jgi:pSer/pThr/pTyr-binding forkhead associated (FHA) protein
VGYTLQDSSGRQIQIGLMLRIGSDPANEIVLSDQKVAPFHATLGDQPDGLLIRDEKSKSGTFVNQKRIKGLVNLNTGDQITIGGMTFIVENKNLVQPALAEIIQPAPSPVIQVEQQLIQTPPPVNQDVLQVIQNVPIPIPKIEPGIKPPILTPEKKRGIGCSMWPLAVIILLSLACLVPVFGGYYLYKAPKATQKEFLKAIGQGPATIQVENFSDNTVFLYLTSVLDRKKEDGSEPISIWEVSSYGTNEVVDLTTGGFRIDFGTKSGDMDLGTCIFNLQTGEVYHFVVLPEYIIIDRTAYPQIFNPSPSIAGEYLVSNSSLCKYKPQ